MINDHCRHRKREISRKPSKNNASLLEYYMPQRYPRQAEYTSYSARLPANDLPGARATTASRASLAWRRATFAAAGSEPRTCLGTSRTTVKLWFSSCLCAVSSWKRYKFKHQVVGWAKEGRDGWRRRPRQSERREPSGPSALWDHLSVRMAATEAVPSMSCGFHFVNAARLANVVQTMTVSWQ